MTDIAPQLVELSAEKLLRLHENLHKNAPTSAIIEAHHLSVNEMLRRGMARPKDDLFEEFEIEVDYLENVDLTSLSSALSDEVVLDVIKTTGSSIGNVRTVLTMDGYQMRFVPIEPEVIEKEVYLREDKTPAQMFEESFSTIIGNAIEKHLQGKHDQKSHAPKYARGIADQINDGAHPSVLPADVGALLSGMSKLTDHPDITELKVQGTLLFGDEGLGIARSEMPQIPGKVRPQFLSELMAKGVTVEKEKVDPLTLKPIQKEISGSRAGAIYEKFKKDGEVPKDERILISSDGFVVDGHHTWAASVGLAFDNKGSQLPVYRIGLTAKEALKVSLEWSKANGYESQGIAAPAKKSYGEEFEDFDSLVLKHGSHDQSTHGAWANGIHAVVDVAPKAERSPGAVKEAIALRERMVKVEPEITKTMVAITESVGGRLEGLDQRIKSTDSLARKIDADSTKEHQGDAKKAADAVSDGLRYTQVLTGDKYYDGLVSTVSQLQEQGFIVRTKNFWQDGDPYQGVNIKATKNGVTSEIQIHTPESLSFKDKVAHPLYEEYRSKTNDVERLKLWDRMKSEATKLAKPANYSSLLLLPTLVLQQFETARQAGLVKAKSVLQYYAKVDIENNPLLLFRIGGAPFEAEFNGEWESTNRLSDAIVNGTVDFVNLTEEEAQQVFPEAFTVVGKSVGGYEVSKAETEKRYTLGAMYIPDSLDAHGEWTSAEELQNAVWDYVKSGDRGIRLQHNRDVVAGEWLEIMAFPYPLTVPHIVPDGMSVEKTYPANTVFLGVVWEPWAWDMVKSGKIMGYSIGGKAERLYVDLPEIEKDATVNDVHADTIMGSKKKKLPKVLQDTPIPTQKPSSNETMWG